MGYRLRMTLAFGLLALASVVFLTSLFLWSSYREFRADRVEMIGRMSECLAGNVYWDMRALDPARVEDSLARFVRGLAGAGPVTVAVLDANGRLYASTAERAGKQTGTQAFALDPTYGPLVERLPPTRTSVTREEKDRFLTGTTVERDGERMGAVVVDYPLSSLERHFRDLFGLAAVYSVLLLAILLAIGWALGRAMMAPVLRLRECMRRVGQGDLEVRCEGVHGHDELGELARGLEEMVSGLREKRQMEQEMLRSERLAAVGQMAAGVAHEINNPLGGMLNAINTFRRHGSDPTVAERTLDLLQRGLVQIQQTVHALLVEARVQDRPLAEEDLEDVRTLVQADAGGKGVRLEWDCRLGGATALPSAPVRHVLINLLLNAIRAAPEGGRVRASCAVSDDRLRLRVADDGPGLPPAVRARLFEPQPSASGGHGFGLWVTHQTVKRLGGQIEARDGAPGTVFEVVLPATIPETTP